MTLNATRRWHKFTGGSHKTQIISLITFSTLHKEARGSSKSYYFITFSRRGMVLEWSYGYRGLYALGYSLPLIETYADANLHFFRMEIDSGKICVP